MTDLRLQNMREEVKLCKLYITRLHSQSKHDDSTTIVGMIKSYERKMFKLLREIANAKRGMV